MGRQNSTQDYVVPRHLPGGVVGQVGGVQVGVLLSVRTDGLDHLPSNFVSRFLQTPKVKHVYPNNPNSTVNIKQ